MVLCVDETCYKHGTVIRNRFDKTHIHIENKCYSYSFRFGLLSVFTTFILRNDAVEVNYFTLNGVSADT